MSAEKLNESLDALEKAVASVREAMTAYQADAQTGLHQAAGTAAAHGGGVEPFVYQRSSWATTWSGR